jgi:hypothetical protein|tara:strand:- start:62 stop:427 length:366 start_codon:yes stop_codon:yes gene_type:complete
MARNISGNSNFRTFENQQPIKNLAPGSIPKEMADSDKETYKQSNLIRLYTNDPDRSVRMENIQHGILSTIPFWQKDPAVEERLIRLHKEGELKGKEKKYKMYRSMLKSKEITLAEFKELML